MTGAPRLDFTPLTQLSAGPPKMIRRIVDRPTQPKFWTPLLILLFASVAFGVLMGLGTVVFLAIESLLGEPGYKAGAAFWVGTIAPTGVGAAFFGMIVGTIYWNVTQYSYVPSLVSQLPAFAATNGLAFTASGGGLKYPGSVFRMGGARPVNRITARSGRFFEIGDVQLGSSNTVAPEGSGSHANLMWGYIAIDLGRNLPHIVLEPRLDTDEYTPLAPMLPDHDQALSLEGDFDKYFTLYCPQGYERDALYIFAPDLMGLFVDWTGGLSAEILDQWLFIYAFRPFSASSPADFERAFRVVELIGNKAERQTRQYVDERSLVPRSVARRGQRLRRDPSRWVSWTLPALRIGAPIGAVIALLSLLLISVF